MEAPVVPLKTILVGPSYAGKTSFMNQYVLRDYITNSLTINVGFQSKKVQTNLGLVKIQLWDIYSGSEKYEPYICKAFQITDGIMIIYNAFTDNNLPAIMKEIGRANKYMAKHCILCLFANKLDLKNENKDCLKGRKLSKKYNMKYLEGSVKENMKVDEAMKFVIEEGIASKIGQ